MALVRGATIMVLSVDGAIRVLSSPGNAIALLKVRNVSPMTIFLIRLAVTLMKMERSSFVMCPLPDPTMVKSTVV